MITVNLQRTLQGQQRKVRFTMCNFQTRVFAMRNVAVVLLCAAAVGMCLTPRAAGDEWDKKTIVTTNTPIEIPGRALPAGTYVFKLADSTANRNIVQIYDKDEKHLLGTVLAIPNYRLHPTDKPVLYFEERPSGSPEAVKAWFYPGDQYGQEFVYPHDRATELAKANHENVLSTSSSMKKNMTTSSKDAKSASVQELEKADVNGVSPSGEPVALIVIVSTTPDPQQ